jgi:hypothetical protein
VAYHFERLNQRETTSAIFSSRWFVTNGANGATVPDPTPAKANFCRVLADTERLYR